MPENTSSTKSLALSWLLEEIAVTRHDANGLLAATQFFLAIRAHPIIPTPSLLVESSDMMARQSDPYIMLP